MINQPTTNGSTMSDDDEDTIGSTVPWFFMEDDRTALRAQAGWSERHLGLSDGFYARFLGVPEPTFREWKLGRGELPADRQDVLRRFWNTVGYLLELTALDPPEAKAFLERPMRAESTELWTDPRTPPWNGSCMKSYLEDGGPGILRDVDLYLASLGAGNPMFS